MKHRGLPFIALFACGCSGESGLEGTDEVMPIVLVTRDLSSEPPELEILRAHPESPPSVQVMCPSTDHRLDGADMVSLVMPPPAEVRFEIDDNGAPGTLRMKTGAGITVHWEMSEENPEGIFGFEVELNGELVHESRTRVLFENRSQGSEWADVPPIEVVPGDVVTLRTEAIQPDGKPLLDPPVLQVGFGGLVIERYEELRRTRSSPEQPNVLLVVMDTLRADRLSAYGYPRETSPHLEELARRGTLFENAFSAASWTWPSTASIMTGLQPEEHGVQNAATSLLERDLTTLAESLQLSGFTTAGWSGNPLIARSRNFAQGFEHFDDDRGGFRKTGAFFDDVVEWLDGVAGTRFFLYLHLTEPHQRYRALPEGKELLASDVRDDIVDVAVDVRDRLAAGAGWSEDGASLLEELTTGAEREEISTIYDACVWTGDHWLGRILRELELRGLDDETVIVFTSDHGEELFERNNLGHGKTVYHELVRIPLVIAGPGIPSGVRIATPTSNTDLAPFLSLLGHLPLESGFDGNAFLSGVDAPVLYSTAKGFWKGHQLQTIRGLRQGDLSVQFAPNAADWQAEPTDGDACLFDIASDPGELHDLSEERPEEFARMLELLRERYDALALLRSQTALSPGEGIEDMLERIGYAGH